MWFYVVLLKDESVGEASKLWLASGMSHSDIISDYPELTEQDIRACLAFAADRERRALSAA